MTKNETTISKKVNKWIVTGIFVRKTELKNISAKDSGFIPEIVTIICNFEISEQGNYSLEKIAAISKAFDIYNINDSVLVLHMDAEKIDYTIDDYPVYEKLWIDSGFSNSSIIPLRR